MPNLRLQYCVMSTPFKNFSPRRTIQFLILKKHIRYSCNTTSTTSQTQFYDFHLQEMQLACLLPLLPKFRNENVNGKDKGRKAVYNFWFCFANRIIKLNQALDKHLKYAVMLQNVNRQYIKFSLFIKQQNIIFAESLQAVLDVKRLILELAAFVSQTTHRLILCYSLSVVFIFSICKHAS